MTDFVIACSHCGEASESPDQCPHCLEIRGHKAFCPDKYEGALSYQVGGSHYKDFAIQPIEFITQNKLSFCEGNVVKYICRHSMKGGVEDLKKVIHYAKIEAKQTYGEDI